MTTVGRIEQLTGAILGAAGALGANSGTGCQPLRQLTEEDVRRIVREEMALAMLAIPSNDNS